MADLGRGDFERLVQRALDPVLRPYGFSLSPQPPADAVCEGRATAVYEMTLVSFVQRFPTWSQHWNFEEPLHQGCVDLWVEADLATNDVRAEIEGEGVRDLVENADAAGDETMPRSLEEALTHEAELCQPVLASRADS